MVRPAEGNLIKRLACLTAVGVLALTTTTLSLRAQVIGHNFTGSNRAQAGFNPPDSMAAVGPNHVVELINGRYAVYEKFGVNNPNGTRTPLVATSLNSFWTSGGIAVQNFAFDPRVIYDPFSGRFFACSVDNIREPNSFLVAVSNSSNPLGGWRAFKVDSDATNGRWADFPTMGVNADGVYISANMFIVTQPGQQTHMLAIPKGDLVAPSPTIANARLFTNAIANIGVSAQPVLNLDNTSVTPFMTFTNVLRRTDLVGGIAAGTFSAPINTTHAAGPNPPDAPQGNNSPTPKANIHTLDNRLSANVVLQEGVIWGVNTIQYFGKAALSWFKVRESDNVVLQSGVITDPQLHFYYGSVGVNEFGDIVIAASGSSPNHFVSSYAFVGDSLGDTVSGTTTFGAPMLLKAGVDDFEAIDGAGRNRWGDYSATMVDPSNPLSFWTIQEFCSADNQWSMQVTQILIPEPSSLLAFACATLLLLRRRRVARV